MAWLVKTAFGFVLMTFDRQIIFDLLLVIALSLHSLDPVNSNLHIIKIVSPSLPHSTSFKIEPWLITLNELLMNCNNYVWA